MRRRRSVLVTITATVAVLALAGTVLAGGAPRFTTLSGGEEIPVGADPDGSGFAEIRLNVGQRTVCWELTVANIDPAFAAHIHAAPAGVNGPVVVPLSAPTTGTSSGCREGVDPALIQAIIDYPELYYVNVHNAQFPGGALRGQLSNPGQSE